MNKRALDLAIQDEQQLGFVKPVRQQIEDLTEQDLQFTQSEWKNALHFDTENLTQEELAAQLVSRAALTPERAKEVAFALKKGESDG